MFRIISVAAIALLISACSDSDSTAGSTNNTNSTNPSGSTTNPDTTAQNDFCPTGSLYDNEEDSCYINCDDLTDEQCDIRYQEVFADFDQFVIDSYQGNSPTTTSTAKAKYQVNEDLSLTVVQNAEPQRDGLFNEIWTNANKILPRTKIQSSVSQYHIDSDGESGTLAYVVNDVNLPEKWVIAYDDADYSGASDPEFTHTTVHEFGHIVFLSSDQLDIRSTGSCPNYGVQEGCSFAQSYINRFYQTFWASIIDEHRALQSDEDKQRFYERYQDQFVSEYASTNPVEDAAEVFTSFVLKDKPANGDTVVNQKILLMHDIEALVNLRREIRGKLTLNRERQKRVSM